MRAFSFSSGQGLKAPAWLFVALAACAFAGARAQTAPATPSVLQADAEFAWAKLTASQRQALQPLAKLWPSMEVVQQRKWIALAQTFPKLSAAEREKMQARMAEWAALSPRERTAARLNFAQTKSIDKADRAANWEAYQALPPEEKQKLAAKAPTKPVGAAPAVKPIPPQKLTPVPVTRNSPAAKRDAAAAKTPLNRNTLLPAPATPAATSPAAVSAPAPAAAPAGAPQGLEPAAESPKP